LATLTEGYSLWIIPSKSCTEKLQDGITQLSRLYKAPAFKPHITILQPWAGSETAAIANAEKFAGSIKPYPITFAGVDFSNEFFQCVFLRVKETSEVMEAYRKTNEAFGMTTYPPYSPHLSLLYGNFSAQEKQKAIDQVGSKLVSCNFTANRFHLYHVCAEIQNWRLVREFII
jgi:2'-5' RNA ligase